MEKEEIPSKEVNKKRIGCWQLSALFIYGVLIVLSIPLVEGVYLHFLSSKSICKRLLSGEITEQKASDVLISKGGWRGGGEGALFYQCGYFLKGEESYIR